MRDEAFDVGVAWREENDVLVSRQMVRDRKKSDEYALARRIPALLIVMLMLPLWVLLGCTRGNEGYWRMSLATVQTLTSGHIVRCEKKQGDILFSFVDEFGDGHIFLLDHHGVSDQEALHVVQSKMAELDKVKKESPVVGDGKTVPPQQR
jgi:hypothetical protein